jgi:peptide deformylase
MTLDVITYPNPLLKEKSQDVVEFDEKLHTFLDDMYDTMIIKEGVGLASIQVGIPKNILIINIPNKENEQLKEDLIEAINPVILEKDGSTKFKEGCLSVPDFNEMVIRAKHIKVKFYDRFGNKHIKEYEDFLAVAWQHEMDHLNGKLFIERLSILKRRKFEKEFKKLHKKRR